MKEEVALQIDYIERVMEHLHDYAVALQKEGNVPFSKLTESLREQASDLVKQVEGTRKDISDLAERYEYENGETAEGNAIRDISVDAADEVGSLAATVDLATGELPGFGNPSRSSSDVGDDFMRSSEHLKTLKTRLAKVKVK